MTDHSIKFILTVQNGLQTVKTHPDLRTFKYDVGDTFTFTSDHGDLRAQCSVPGVAAIPVTPISAPKGSSFTTYPLPKEPFLCNCGLTLADGTEVGWPHDSNAGNQTGGGTHET
jgi:hypothetical protein